MVILLAVVFLPFPTRLLAEAPETSGERVFVTMYGLTLLAIRLLGSALDAYARHEHLYSPREDGEEPQDTPPKKLLPVVIGYVIAILIGPSPGPGAPPAGPRPGQDDLGPGAGQDARWGLWALAARSPRDFASLT